VTITTSDGRSVTHRPTAVHGTPENPMSRHDVTHKARGLIEPVFGKAKTAALIDTLWSIEAVADVRMLRPLLGAGRDIPR
jgi:hypothetical protein